MSSELNKFLIFMRFSHAEDFFVFNFYNVLTYVF